MPVFVHNRILLDRGVKDTDKCQCGGFRCVVHCPECGSTQCYAAKRKNTEIYLSDSPKSFPNRGFNCKQCGTIFTELESLTSCHVRHLGELKVQAKIESVIDKQKSLDLLEDYFELHPEKRPKKQQVRQSVPDNRERTVLELADEERERLRREQHGGG